MTETLKPCPFCGGQPTISQEVDYRRGGELVPDSYSILCEADDHCVDTGHWATLAEATRRWNRRASDWQPIETAPRDESHFWAVNIHEARKPTQICWNPWIGKFARNAGPGDPQPVRVDPTHWILVPEPPEGQP